MQGQGSLPKKILVFRALKLGDMLYSIPALRALRKTFPESQITLLTLPAMENHMQRFRHYIDEVFPFPGFPGIPGTRANPVMVVNFLKVMQEREFDLAIQMHGSGEISNPLVLLMNAQRTIGYFQGGEFCPDPLNFRIYPEHRSEVHRCLSMLEILGVDQDDDRLEFPLWPEDFYSLADLPFVPKNYICLHPGASTVSKRWSPGNFARVGDYLADLGFRVVFTGTPMDLDLVHEIQQRMKNDSIDTAGMDLPLGPLAALIRGSAGLICNDTGVSHLASALEIPSIVINTETDTIRWVPSNQELHHVLGRPGIEEVLISINYRLLAGENQFNPGISREGLSS